MGGQTKAMRPWRGGLKNHLKRDHWYERFPVATFLSKGFKN